MIDDKFRDIATMSDGEFRRYCAELYRQHDRYLAEAHEEERQRKAAARDDRAQEGRRADGEGAHVRKSSPNDLSPIETENAPVPAAVAQTLCFTEEGEAFMLPFSEEQADAIGGVMAELHAEWQRDIERLERRLLDTVVRLVMPGERAEETYYALSDRVARMESYIERQLGEIVERRLKAAITDDVLELPNWRKDNAAA